MPAATPLNISEAFWSRTLVSARGGDGVDNDEDGSTGDLRSRSGLSPVADIAPVVGGTLGSLAPPTIISFSVDDPDNGDEVYGAGDVLTIAFDRAIGGLGGGVGGVGDGPYRESVGAGPYTRAEVDRLPPTLTLTPTLPWP